MRILHRDIGFLLIGITIVFSFSGIVLIYRDTDVFRVERAYTVQLSESLDARGFRREIDLRRVSVLEETADEIIFERGSYDKKTGVAAYTLMEYPYLISRMNFMHRAISREALHAVATVYGILLIFLAVSSFWMFKPGTRLFRRGLVLGAIGCFFAVALFVFWR